MRVRKLGTLLFQQRFCAGEIQVRRDAFLHAQGHDFPGVFQCPNVRLDQLNPLASGFPLQIRPDNTNGDFFQHRSLVVQGNLKVGFTGID